MVRAEVCDTDRMRVYLPATVADLAADLPPRVRAFTVIAPGGAHGEELEVLEDEAQDEAALDSLRRLRDDTPGAPPRRLVMALDVHPTSVPEPLEAGSATGVLDLDPAPGWEAVVAYLLDEAEAEEAVRRVLTAGNQEEADVALAALWDHPLQWFDASERSQLLARWTAPN